MLKDNEIMYSGLEVTMSKNTYNLLCYYREKYIKDMSEKNTEIEKLQQKIDKVIEYIEKVTENLIMLEDLQKENADLKQALIDIREYVNSEKFFIRMDEPNISFNEVTKYELVKDDISQIIDKVLGGSDE